MKRLLALLPLAVLVTACGSAGSHASRIVSHTARLDDVSLRLDVTRVQRRAGVAALDLRLANRSPSGSDGYSIDDTFSNDGSYDVSGVVMLDKQTGREIAPMDPSSPDLDIEIAPGGTQTIRTVFPAPRGDKVDVLVPHFGLFRDVPVR